MNSINSINLVVYALLDYERTVEYFRHYGDKRFYNFMINAERYARKWSYTFLEGEEKAAAIALFNEINEQAKGLKFVETYCARKGQRTTVYDHHGPIVSVKDGHYGDKWLVDAAMKYGRQWRTHCHYNPLACLV